MSAADIGQLLLVSDRKNLDDVKQLILETLRCNKDPWFVYSLVDFYVQSQSRDALDILFQVTEPHDKQILDRLCDLLKGTTNRLQALMLCGQLVQKQLPWIYNISKHNIFSYIIKIIKEATDVPILVSAVLLISSVLPLIPVSVKQHLHDIFDGFSRLAKFHLIKPGNVPDVYLLHLQVGVCSLFHRLYGMYPCHFLTYLRTIYSKRDNQQVFQESIMPLLERVRMHPLLVTASKDKEISTERWRNMEVHDIVLDCARLSLDLLEGSYEGSKCPVMGTIKYPTADAKRDAHPPLGGTHELIPPTSMENVIQPIVMQLQSTTTPMFSPSHVCALYTPPPPGEAPQAGAARQLTYAQTGDVTVTSAEKDQKRLSGLRLSMAGIIPSPVIGGGSGSVPPSPLRPDFSAGVGGSFDFSSPYSPTTRSPATRRIDFQQQLSKPGVKTPVSRTSSQEVRCHLEPSRSLECEGHAPLKATVSEGNVRMAHLLRQSTLDDNFTAVTERIMTSPQRPQQQQQQPQEENKQHKETTKPEAEMVTSKPSQTQLADDAKDDSQIQSGSTSAATAATAEQLPNKPADNVKVKPDESPSVPIPGSKVKVTTERQESHSVPSIIELPHFIESLSEGHEDVGCGDDEVATYVGSHLTDSSSSTEPTDVNLTAESVQQFMKTVNRIRFHSMNMSAVRDRNGSDVTSGDRHHQHQPRSSSCPDFEEEPTGGAAAAGAGLEASAKTAQDDVSSDHVKSAGQSASSTESASITDPTSISVNLTTTTRSKTTTQKTVTICSESTTTVSAKSSSMTVTADDNSVTDTSHTNVGGPGVDDDVSTVFPYAHMIPGGLHVAPFLQCYNCSCGGDRVATDVGQVALSPSSSSSFTSSPSSSAGVGQKSKTAKLNKSALGIEKPYFTTLSPAEILDRQLKLGHDVYRAEAAEAARASGGDKQAQAHWPIVDGVAWSDNVTTLRGQILLLHNQLMYERHKREVYAKRNRRLLKPIVNVAALEERNAAMKDQIRVQYDFIHRLEADITYKQATIRGLEQAREKSDYQRDLTQRSQQQEIEILKQNESALTEELQRVKVDRERLFKEMQSTRAQLFDCEQELSISKTRADFALDLQGQIARLNKELVLMGELQQKYQQRLGSVTSSPHSKQEKQFLIDSYKQELNKTKRSLDEYTVMYDATKARLTEAEQALKVKESTISELKTLIEDIKKSHKCYTQVLQEKYTTQRRVQEALHGRIMELTAQVELAQYKPAITPPSPASSAHTPASSAASANEADFMTDVTQQPM